MPKARVFYSDGSTEIKGWHLRFPDGSGCLLSIPEHPTEPEMWFAIGLAIADWSDEKTAFTVNDILFV
jgi:hypothetical protein